MRKYVKKTPIIGFEKNKKRVSIRRMEKEEEFEELDDRIFAKIREKTKIQILPACISKKSYVYIKNLESESNKTLKLETRIMSNNQNNTKKLGSLYFLYTGESVSTILWAVGNKEPNKGVLVVTYKQSLNKNTNDSIIDLYDIDYWKGQSIRMSIKHKYGECCQIHVEKKKRKLVFICLFTSGDLRMFSITRKAKESILGLETTAFNILNEKITFFTIDISKNRRIITAHDDGSIRVWILSDLICANKKKPEHVFPSTSPLNTPIAFSSIMESSFLCSKRDGNLEKYYLNGKSEILSRGPKFPIYKVDYYKTTKKAIIVQDNLAYIKDLESHQKLYLSDNLSLITDIATSFKQLTLACGCLDGRVQITWTNHKKNKKYKKFSIKKEVDEYVFKEFIDKNAEDIDFFSSDNSIVSLAYDKTEKEDDTLAIANTQGMIVIIRV